MASGDVADSVGHRQQRESEGERHSGEADSEMGEAGRQDGATASAQHQPKRPDELGSSTPRKAHSHYKLSCNPSLMKRA